MHQNVFGGRASPDPLEGAHSAPPDLLTVFGEGRAPRKGKGNGEGKRKGEEGGKGKRGGERKRNGKEGRGGEGECAPPIFTGAPHFLIPGIALELNIYAIFLASVT